jgi:hypothetical protein
MSGGKKAGISHWSKDYVEHLRTVHFTLIALVTALVLFFHLQPKASRGNARALAPLAEKTQRMAVSKQPLAQW